MTDVVGVSFNDSRFPVLIESRRLGGKLNDRHRRFFLDANRFILVLPQTPSYFSLPKLLIADANRAFRHLLDGQSRVTQAPSGQ